MSTLNGVIENYALKASYVGKDKNSSLRLFQVKLLDFFKNPSTRVAILHAPTGSGKTFAFKQLGSEDKKILIVLPNNLLAKEVAGDIGPEAGVLNKDSVDEAMRTTSSESNPQFNSRSKAIDLIIQNHTYVITNPTVFSYLLTNHYTGQSKEDMLTVLLKRQVSCVIFDEFHIYSKDQLSTILAHSIIVPHKIKLLFTSATPQSFFIGLCKEIFGQDEVEDISIERLYTQTEETDLLQGPIDFKVVNHPAEEFVQSNIEIFKQGTWMFVLDSNKNVHNVAKLLFDKYGEKDIAVLSAYYDPTYEAFRKLQSSMTRKRILIASNIVEQGINLGKGFLNFVIEPGLRVDNTIQRIGRVGRGVKNVSNVYLCFSNELQTFRSHIETVDDLFQSLREFKYQNNEMSPTAFTVGTYAGVLISKLSGNAGNTIRENILNYKNSRINAGLFCVEGIDSTLGNAQGRKSLKRNCLKSIEKVYSWFKVYKETFYEFIHADERVSIEDIDFSDSWFSTKYDKIWAIKNKEILSNGPVMSLGHFLSRTNYDFNVIVTNLPMGNRSMKYGEIYFKSWKRINEDITILLSDFMCEENEKVLQFINDIKEFTKATAGVERLKMEIDDEY